MRCPGNWKERGVIGKADRAEVIVRIQRLLGCVRREEQVVVFCIFRMKTYRTGEIALWVKNLLC